MLKSSQDYSCISDIVSFIDESGINGLVRNLKPQDDKKISLICALPIPAEDIPFVRRLIEPYYKIFRDAAPIGQKLHVTSAFAPDQEQWRVAAEVARDGIFDVIKSRRLIIVYAARRAGRTRLAYERNKEDRVRATIINQESDLTIPGIERPGNEFTLELPMLTLLAKINSLLSKLGRLRSDICSDEIDPKWRRAYGEIIKDLHEIRESNFYVIKRKISTNKIVKFNAKIKLETNIDEIPSRIGIILDPKKGQCVRDDPLIFMADIVANHLHRHLSFLDIASPLNASESITGWELKTRTVISQNPCLLDIV
ncbi:hypothetical protein [Komagataeibacter rhaeticus]|uniref:Uncharacterized protein n=1 Tax=Komagataeibacter rhaeticus TaxID=215221 RepID=A0A181C517_9PROT|nr:hypothetical protein [Komagataeibacter rhaeticus]QIP36822.1 hypothetical protein GWK63_16660 [Komagataeibacter rhaeticus]QOC46593.1 hypothetical protein ICJ78_16640 [Komagataeibacter rhaeticus]WPP22110.1 hypothetical protein SCD25_01025 [Komagataeibacter rhaeticus]SAY46657.1 hypothetical protein KRIGEM_03443 [Komagataeibacter rhaeticus]